MPCVNKNGQYSLLKYFFIEETVASLSTYDFEKYPAIMKERHMERADSSVEPWMIPAEEMASQNQQYADSFCDIKRRVSSGHRTN